MFGLISQFFCNLNSSKNFTCLSDKLITEFTGPIAKSVSPRPSDTTFFVTDVQRLDHYSKQIMLTLTLTLFRDLDRERSKLEQQEKKVIADIKKMALKCLFKLIFISDHIIATNLNVFICLFEQVSNPCSCFLKLSVRKLKRTKQQILGYCKVSFSSHILQHIFWVFVSTCI